MLTGTTTSWILSSLFGVTGLWYVAFAVRSLHVGHEKNRDAVNAGLHALMSAAMIAMLWSWRVSIPAITLVTVFTAAAACYVARLVLTPAPAWVETSDDETPDRHEIRYRRRGRGHHDTPLGNAYHAVMMASMAWMAIAMSTMTIPAALATTSNSGMAGMSAMGGGSAMSMGITPGWIKPACQGLGIGFFAAAACYLFTIIVDFGNGKSKTNRELTASNAAGSAMAVGMAIAFFDMT